MPEIPDRIDASGTTGRDQSSPQAAEPVRSSPIPLIASLAMHVLLLTTLGILLGRRDGGSNAVADRAVGIATVTRLPDRDRYETDSAETEDQSTANDAAAAASGASPTSVQPPIDLEGILQELQSAPVPTGGSGLAGDNPLGGEAFGGGGPGGNGESEKTETSLFGVSGYGSRFVYVLDRSDSMNGYAGRPLRAAKRELASSLAGLSDLQQFQIVFYNDKPTPYQFGSGTLQLLTGSESMVEAAGRYVRSIRAFGGTEHSSALKLALRMRPDVIFFLTDARIPRLSGSQLNEIRVRAASAGTTIHAIEFGTDPAAPVDSFLKDLAAQNGGEYRYFDVGKL